MQGNISNKNLAQNFKNWANLIVRNPPYLNDIELKDLQPEVKFEPKLTLYDGQNSLMFYGTICKL